MKNCNQCKFWSGRDTNPNATNGLKYGECRRNAPVVIVLSMPAQYPESHFPVTTEDLWCGEWREWEEKR